MTAMQIIVEKARQFRFRTAREVCTGADSIERWFISVIHRGSERPGEVAS